VSGMTPVQELREAAADMRVTHGPSHIRHAFWSAVAYWLECEADKFEQNMVFDQRDTESALDAARAYRGSGEQ